MMQAVVDRDKPKVVYLLIFPFSMKRALKENEFLVINCHNYRLCF